ncbi:redoxin domain-containing protein [Hyunsoonleella sp. SJ7]|uniref:Redoxin domain-containing protein n=1 Tax=Hyunsoonleella aquatilis TaxID=2762758 RepID=A0A923HA94_9FLAO|nr:redoxin domain-containing protein [Hyunsoonleella aquatilis]MBC3757256.1 redoxin domain-containing protein [Hyunsoonleella aquatilis]
MKKIFKFVIPILILVVLFFLGYSVIGKIQYKTEVESLLQTIPEFQFATLEGMDFSNSNLKQNLPTVFIYFNTECGYCQHEAQNIGSNIPQFKNAQLIFVSTETTEAIAQFAKTYQLHNTPNITFLHDTAYHFSNRFDATCVPYVLIYNAKQELVKKHKGQLKAETILKLIEDNQSVKI